MMLLDKAKAEAVQPPSRCHASSCPSGQFSFIHPKDPTLWSQENSL